MLFPGSPTGSIGSPASGKRHSSRRGSAMAEVATVNTRVHNSLCCFRWRFHQVEEYREMAESSYSIRLLWFHTHAVSPVPVDYALLRILVDITCTRVFAHVVCRSKGGGSGTSESCRAVPAHVHASPQLNFHWLFRQFQWRPTSYTRCCCSCWQHCSCYYYKRCQCQSTAVSS